MWGSISRHCIRLSTKKSNGISLSPLRLYSVIHTPYVETVEVTCRSSGHITLNIYHPSTTNSTRPLLIYLPPLSPRSPPPAQTPPPPSLLSQSATVIQINPRWSPSHPFPTPIHDSLHAYTWILDHIISTPPHHANAPPRPIAIYGSGLGGTLATSLALTESHSASSAAAAAASKHAGSYIAGLLIRDAVFDWSGIASSAPPPLAPTSSAQDADLDLQRLYELRGALFREPAGAFDAFASPVLFFRTAGVAVPRGFPSLLSLSAEGGRDEGPAAYVARRSHLTFPPRGSGLRIPWTRVAVTGRGGTGGVEVEKEGGRKGRVKAKGNGGQVEGGGVLKVQAEEMVKLMRRSVILHEGKERRNSGAFDGVWEAERRVVLVELEGEKGGYEVDDGRWATEILAEDLGFG